MSDIRVQFDENLHFDITRTIDHIEKTSTVGLVDTYTIYYEDGTTSEFTVTNGEKGDKGDTGNGIQNAVLNADYTLTLTFSDGTSYTTPSIRGEQGIQGIQGETGNGIASIAKKSTVGLVDTYTITFTNGQTFDFEVNNGTASIDKTLSISDRAADAKVTGDKISTVESNVEYGINGILNGNYRKRITGKEMQWTDGGINSTTGADNANASSIRTGFLTFEEAKIAVIDPHQAYRIYLHSYNKETGAWIKQENKTDIRSEYQFTLNPDYKYRIQLYNTAQDARAVCDDFVMYDTAVQSLSQLDSLESKIDYNAETLATGHFRKRILGSDITWEDGGIGSSGQKTSGAYAVRTGDFLEFDSSIIAGDGPENTDYYLGFVAYNKETDAYVQQSYIRNISAEKQITIDPQYKYKIYITDATSTARPSGDTLTLYECRDDIIKKRKAEVSSNLAHRGGFRQRKPLVTIIDDDGYLEFYNRCFDENDNYLLHAPICSAYEGVNLGNGNFMSVDQLKRLEAVGCEILGHGGVALAPKTKETEEHPITPEEVEADVIANLVPLLNAGFDPVGYCYPYGACNVKSREIIGKYYSYAMTGIRHLPTSSPDYDKLHNFGCIPHYAINRYPLFDADNHLKSWNDISQVVADTVADNGWLVLYLHFWKDPTRTCTAETLNAIIDQIVDAGAEIVTATEGFEIFRNAWQAGDYLGGWNKVNSWGIEYEDHTLADAGSAVNMLGETDFKE